MAFKFVPAKDLESWLRSYAKRSATTFQQTAVNELNSVLERPAEEEPAPSLCRAQSCGRTFERIFRQREPRAAAALTEEA